MLYLLPGPNYTIHCHSPYSSLHFSRLFGSEVSHTKYKHKQKLQWAFTSRLMWNPIRRPRFHEVSHPLFPFEMIIKYHPYCHTWIILKTWSQFLAELSIFDASLVPFTSITWKVSITVTFKMPVRYVSLNFNCFIRSGRTPSYRKVQV